MNDSLLNGTQIEEISRVLAEYTTGSRITQMLKTLNMHDMDAIKPPFTNSSSKWMRITNAIIDYQNRHNSNLGLQQIIEYIFTPANFINKSDKSWFEATTAVNRILQFNGMEINDSGKITTIVKTKTYSGGTKRYNSLKLSLENLQVHQEIIALCRPEILDKNYFHLILEASKSVLNKVRSISCLCEDGNKLIERSFSIERPIVVINKLDTDTEKSEYNGLKFLLKAIVCLYRNPKAHELKAYSVDSEEDTVSALLLMSQAHKLLDKCGRNSAIPL